ncbi:MAG: iron-sulfur cluster assembly scaffold protein, partial [Planctomycetota bacterium]|nr:iron-sulfur cluster assembly scaffold protein [Planctomycetota bacterium]
SPYHRGRIPHSTLAHEAESRVCGDLVHLELVLDATLHIWEAWFDGRGCAISQAAASLLTQMIEGKSAVELRGFQSDDMLALLAVRLSSARRGCGLLPWEVLQSLLERWPTAPPAPP